MDQHTLAAAAADIYPAPPAPFLRLSAAEQEVMLLNARCIAAGLPPFPVPSSYSATPSTTPGVLIGSSSSPSTAPALPYSQSYHRAEFQELFFAGCFAPPDLSSLPEPEGLEMMLGLAGGSCGFPLLMMHGEGALLDAETHHYRHTTSMLKLKAPKVEVQEYCTAAGSIPVNTAAAAAADASSDCLGLNDSPPWLQRLLPGCHRLPGLQQSLDTIDVTPNRNALVLPAGAADCKYSRKRIRLSTVDSSLVTLDTQVITDNSINPRSLQLMHPLPPPPPAANIGVTTNKTTTPKPQMPSTSAARRRRRSISDRVKLLASLMPWERKMDTATLLEKARKYVVYLQAQVRALKYMPAISYYNTSATAAAAAVHGHEDFQVYGGLERLTRQQLLQLVVNSPMVQDRLCSLGLCLYSAEQVLLIHRIAESRMQEHHDLFPAGQVLSG